MTKAVTGRKRQSKEVRPRGVVRRMGDESEGRYPMSLASDQAPRPDRAIDWPALMSELGPRFAARADNYDATDAFVAENFAELKARDVFAAGVPSELGGGGASYSQLCDMLRTLAHYCGSTALTLSMHTHAVATIVWRWRRDPKPLQDFLRRIVDDRLVLVVSGASDWLNSSGAAQRVAGGWRVNGKKIFASGSPFGDLLMTQAVDQASAAEAVVLHFPISLRNGDVEVQDTWHVLGMRGTGSHDVVIKDAFVPESAISLRRPQGEWTPAFHLVACTIPLPLVYAVYLGVAEAARDKALVLARKRAHEPGMPYLVGEMENELACARMAHRDMVEAAEACEEPGPETTNRIVVARTLVGRAVTSVAEKAMEVAGGSSFYRASGLERLFRDIQGARFHRPQERAQLRFSGRLALGLDLDE
jgi:alkylation response protein AidB-like acyl-CoA dehydrogenase